MCLVLSETPLLFANQIAPTLSTLILMGNGTLISMDLRCWYRTLISFTTSHTATYSASVVDKTTLFILLLFHAIGTPQENTMYPYTLILVSLSFAKVTVTECFQMPYSTTHGWHNVQPQIFGI